MKYLCRRLIHAILLLLAISFFSFALLQMAPGDYFDSLRLNPQISSQTVDKIRAQYGLDRPFPIRYALWLRGALQGDLGYSLASNSAVGPLIGVRARNTLLLSGTATALAWMLALPLGIGSASRRRPSIDRATELATSALLTVPDLLLFLALLLLAVRTGWFPTGGMISAANDESSFWRAFTDIAFHLMLPA